MYERGNFMSKIDYVSVGEYLLPAIALRDPPNAEPLTKYGLMRRSYLKDHRQITSANGKAIPAPTRYPTRRRRKNGYAHSATHPTRPAAGQSRRWACVGGAHERSTAHSGGNYT